MAGGARRRALRAAIAGSWVRSAAAVVLLLAAGAIMFAGPLAASGGALGGVGKGGSASAFQRALGEFYSAAAGGGDGTGIGQQPRLRAAVPEGDEGDAASDTDLQPRKGGAAGASAAKPAASAADAEEPPQQQGQEGEEGEDEDEEDGLSAAGAAGTDGAGSVEGLVEGIAEEEQPQLETKPAAPTPSGTPAAPTPSGTPAAPTPSGSKPPPAAAAPAAPAPAPAAAAADGPLPVNIDTIPTPGRDRAIVTLATGDEAARQALALVQSLRDIRTDPTVDIVVLLFPGGVPSEECLRGEWRAAHGRKHIPCGDLRNVAEEIISPAYVAAFRRLGAKVVVRPPIPRYAHTANIPGGTASFWGMALNKLIVFNMTEYRKLIFMDGDTLFFRNVDHLFNEPTFTASITYACCNHNAPAIPSGGLWVLEPSAHLWGLMDEQMRLGEPVYDGATGIPVVDGNGKQTYQEWRLGDMAIVRQVFSSWSRNHHDDRLWPWTVDDRHGHVAGLRSLPVYRVMSDEKFKEVIWDTVAHTHYREGFLADKWDGKTPVWHALNVSYDQCIASCQCMPWRHTPYRRLPDGREEGYFSVHFTCMQANTVEKPGRFETDDAFWTAVEGAHECYVYYYNLWYDYFERAHGGPLPGPRYAKKRRAFNPAVIYNPPTEIRFER